MVLSKRERYIAIATVAAVGILGLDRFVLNPLVSKNSQLNLQIDSCEQQLEKARRLFKNSRRKSQAWAQMQSNGLRRKDAAEAEGLVLNRIRDWAQDAGMSLSSVKPERTEKPMAFGKITFRATGTGGMTQISRFLGRLKDADVPVRIGELQITARKEGTDDLSLQLGISTIYLSPETEKDRPIPVPSSQEVRP
ncbi:MAG TPA: GspMb/PilO family protein [Phycisphaerae bacterium]|nr:GspMb/PilO family protein [Phycisphaerae bacterium]HRY68905.1 GspMb/PilO family protein [Phycisphaerae bacterium]HSA25732.1 GspMb/PilO family protein [Phycisphaerae bacterium]